MKKGEISPYPLARWIPFWIDVQRRKNGPWTSLGLFWDSSKTSLEKKMEPGLIAKYFDYVIHEARA